MAAEGRSEVRLPTPEQQSTWVDHVKCRYCGKQVVPFDYNRGVNGWAKPGWYECDDGCETYWWTGSELRVRCRGCEGKGVTGDVMGDPVAEVLANEKCEECGGTGTAPNDWPEREDYE